DGVYDVLLRRDLHLAPAHLRGRAADRPGEPLVRGPLVLHRELPRGVRVPELDPPVLPPRAPVRAGRPAGPQVLHVPTAAEGTRGDYGVHAARGGGPREPQGRDGGSSGRGGSRGARGIA